MYALKWLSFLAFARYATAAPITVIGTQNAQQVVAKFTQSLAQAVSASGGTGSLGKSIPNAVEVLVISSQNAGSYFLSDKGDLLPQQADTIGDGITETIDDLQKPVTAAIRTQDKTPIVKDLEDSIVTTQSLRVAISGFPDKILIPTSIASALSQLTQAFEVTRRDANNYPNLDSDDAASVIKTLSKGLQPTLSVTLKELIQKEPMVSKTGFLPVIASSLRALEGTFDSMMFAIVDKTSSSDQQKTIKPIYDQLAKEIGDAVKAYGN